MSIKKLFFSIFFVLFIALSFFLIKPSTAFACTYPENDSNCASGVTICQGTDGPNGTCVYTGPCDCYDDSSGDTCTTKGDWCGKPTYGPNYCCVSGVADDNVCNYLMQSKIQDDCTCSGNYVKDRNTVPHPCSYKQECCTAPTCVANYGQECESYGCCSGSNKESECYKQIDCSGNCVYAGLRNEDTYCGNGSCSCNETSSSCPADCGTNETPAPLPTSPPNATPTPAPSSDLRYGCNGNSCEENPTGPYTNSSCDNRCTGRRPDCYNGLLSNTYTTGSCSVTITHKAWSEEIYDPNFLWPYNFCGDSSTGGYRDRTANPPPSFSRFVGVNGGESACMGSATTNPPYQEDGFRFTNDWSTSSGKDLRIATTINQDQNGQGMQAGWVLTTSGCTISGGGTLPVKIDGVPPRTWPNDCSKTSLEYPVVGVNCAESDPNPPVSATNNFVLHYCGDGVCECGETENSCPADCFTAKGYLDSTSCTNFTGWACDADNYNTSIDVRFYVDGPRGTGTYLGYTTAGIQREVAVGNECGGNRNHGFEFLTPDSLKDGVNHLIYANAVSIPTSASVPQLNGSPKTINCPPAPTPIGQRPWMSIINGDVHANR